jgi:gluconolactonase
MTNIREIASGLQFPEGPVVLPDGGFLVVEIRRQTLTRVRPDGTSEVLATTGGGPNSAAVGPDGAVYIPNNGGFVWREELLDVHIPTGEAPKDYTTGRIERVDLATGEVTTLYTECNGNMLRGPNDLVFDAEGNMWFTDTGKGTGRAHDLGGLYFAAADGSHIVEVAHHLWTPNGVALSPDGSVVYVAETITGRLWAWDITGPGEVAKTDERPTGARLVLGLGGHQYLDSMAVEENGNVCVATMVNPGITVAKPDGTWDFVAIDGDPLTTNIAFGGPDLKTAYITASSTGKLLAMDWPRPGLRLNF